MESLIIINQRYEIETSPIGKHIPHAVLKGLNFYCTMWQMRGTERIHAYCIEWGETEKEARENINPHINSLIKLLS